MVQNLSILSIPLNLQYAYTKPQKCAFLVPNVPESLAPPESGFQLRICFS
jgi:hypothetical protein